MSVLSEKLADIKATVIAEVEEALVTRDGYKARIAELEKLVAEGSATPEDLAALDEIKALVQSIDPSNPTTIEAVRSRFGTRAKPASR